MSQDRYVYLRGDIELHYAGDTPASQPPAGQDSRYRLRPTIERRTNSRARLKQTQIMAGPYDPAQLQAESHLNAGTLSAVQIEMAATERGAGEIFREDLLEVYVTNVTLQDVMHQGGKTFGTLRGTGYATLLVPAPAAQESTLTPLTPVGTGWRQWLPNRISTMASSDTSVTGSVGLDWLGVGRVLRYLFLSWLVLGLFGTGVFGMGLVGLLLYFFLSPLLPSWLGLGSLLRYGVGLALLGIGIYFGLHHQWVTAALCGIFGFLLFFGGGRAVGAAVSVVGIGLRLVMGLVLAAALALLALGWLGKQQWGGSTATNDSAEVSGRLSTTHPPHGQPPADSLLMSHLRNWDDLADRHYQGPLAIAQNQFFRARQVREAIPSRDGLAESEDVTMSTLYGTLARTDADHLPRIYAMFDSLGRDRGLNREQFAQMVVTCVQDIPYALVHQGTCDDFDRMAPGLVSEHNRKTCQPGIRFGVQGPAEFMYNLKADCDTRALFLYTVLRHFGYDAAVLISNHYSHSVLGLAQPAASSRYVEKRGHRYYAWETTSKGFPLGMLAPQMSDMRFWDIAVAGP